jgi:hypothetical protein
MKEEGAWELWLKDGTHTGGRLSVVCLLLQVESLGAGVCGLLLRDQGGRAPVLPPLRQDDPGQGRGERHMTPGLGWAAGAHVYKYEMSPPIAWGSA